MADFTHGSACTGIGGFDFGFEKAGFKTIFQIEFEEQQKSSLRRNFRNVPLYGDLYDVDFNELPTVDVYSYGTPCQDVSISNQNREGLDGNRSSAFFRAIEFIRIKRPRIAILENVQGLLTSNKRKDFGRCIETLAQVGHSAIFWTLLDSRFFAVPQRRRRVFLLSASEADRYIIENIASEISTFNEGLSWSSQEGKDGEQSDSQDTGISTSESVGFQSNGGSWEGFAQTEISPTLKVAGAVPPAVAFQRSELRKRGTLTPLEVAPTLASQTGGGDNETNVVQAFRKNRFGNSDFIEDGTASTLCKRDYKDSTDLVLYESHPNDSRLKGPMDVCPTVTRRWGTGGNNTPLVQEPEYRVRRLMPVECERLQSFPEGWTQHGIDANGNEITFSDSKRYQFLGNAVTVNVAEFLARLIKKNLEKR